MDVFCPASAELSLQSIWGKTCKDENWGAAAAGVVDGSTKTLGADVDMDNDTLRTRGQTGVSIGHGEGDHLVKRSGPSQSLSLGRADLVRTCYDVGELVRLRLLTFSYRFDKGRVIGAKINEAIGDTELRLGRSVM